MGFFKVPCLRAWTHHHYKNEENNTPDQALHLALGWGCCEQKLVDPVMDTADPNCFEFALVRQLTLEESSCP